MSLTERRFPTAAFNRAALGKAPLLEYLQTAQCFTATVAPFG
jgi:hypothetical protein